jgi:DNA-binding response OmpR family regulator
MIAQAEKAPGERPLLVLATADSLFAALSCRHFRRLGWEVHLASSGCEARRMARAFNPLVVVLDTELRDESGWLVCDKLTRDMPGQKVVLVSPDPSEENRSLTEFVGAAALVGRDAGVDSLVEEVLESASPAIG